MSNVDADIDGLRAIVQKWGDPPADMISKLPKGGDKNKDHWATCRVCGGWHAKNAVHLDYMGHADVTVALIDVDPGWEWEPLAYDGGVPLIEVANGMATMWIKLTVLGKTRIGVGSCESNKADLLKELYGDALRNAAMRFGIGVKLWSKTDGGIEPEPEPAKPSASGGARSAPARPAVERPSAAPSPQGATEGEDPTAVAKARGAARAAAAFAGEPDPHPPVDPAAERDAVTLPTAVLARMDALIAATPTLTSNQRQVRVGRLVRDMGGVPDSLTAMVADEQCWLAVCDAFKIEGVA